MNQGNGNITSLNDLPELEDLERRADYTGPLSRQIDDEKYQKYLRNPHRIDAQSGMSPNNAFSSGYAQLGSNEQYQMQNQNRQMMIPPSHQIPQQTFGNCIDIARHIQDCPICSKFYSSDKTIYIIIIVILAIVTLLLLKRILNV